MYWPASAMQPTGSNYNWLFSMQLLFDHNLSPKLADLLSDLFPDSAHVYNLGMSEFSDLEIWNYAKENDFYVVTKILIFMN